VVFPDEVPPELLEAIQSSYPGSGDRVVPITPENWETITDAMAATTTTGTAAAVHLEGIDFAGKTGTAQVVSHSAGATSLGKGSERANAWFVGMAPRRNPDIVVAVLAEHGGWGAEAAAPVAAQVINAFVSKQRQKEGNLRMETASVPATGKDSAGEAQASPAGKTDAPAANRPPAGTAQKTIPQSPVNPQQTATVPQPAKPAKPIFVPTATAAPLPRPRLSAAPGPTRNLR
jgi:penicillin-binding protein 2